LAKEFIPSLMALSVGPIEKIILGYPRKIAFSHSLGQNLPASAQPQRLLSPTPDIEPLSLGAEMGQELPLALQKIERLGADMQLRPR
jgi:hypothetical protein